MSPAHPSHERCDDLYRDPPTSLAALWSVPTPSMPNTRRPPQIYILLISEFSVLDRVPSFVLHLVQTFEVSVVLGLQAICQRNRKGDVVEHKIIRIGDVARALRRNLHVLDAEVLKLRVRI